MKKMFNLDYCRIGVMCSYWNQLWLLIVDLKLLHIKTFTSKKLLCKFYRWKKEQSVLYIASLKKVHSYGLYIFVYVYMYKHMYRTVQINLFCCVMQIAVFLQNTFQNIKILWQGITKVMLERGKLFFSTAFTKDRLTSFK